MPNWCDNSLKVHGKKGDLEKFVRECFSKGDGEEIFLDFEKTVPVGDIKDWYERRLEKWGTKWNLDARDSSVCVTDSRVSMWFLSAWSPPIPIMEALTRKYPALVFRLDYNEGGMAFRGVFEGQDGKVQRDQSWDMTERDFKELYPDLYKDKEASCTRPSTS